MMKKLNSIIHEFLIKNKILWFLIFLSGLIFWLYPFIFWMPFLLEINNFYFSSFVKILKYLFLPLFISWSIFRSLWFYRNYYWNKKIVELEDEKSLLENELTTISSIIKDQSNETLRIFAMECLSAYDWAVMRISLYTRNTEWWLTCYSRFSRNQIFWQIKWKTYNQHGIIGKVWEEWNIDELWLFDNTIPEYWENKRIQKKYIKHHQGKYSLEENYIKNISMKSRLYYAYRIEMEWESLWVLLIESLDPKKYTKEQLDSIIPTFSKNLYIVLKTAKHVMSGVGESYKNNFNS